MYDQHTVEKLVNKIMFIFYSYIYIPCSWYKLGFILLLEFHYLESRVEDHFCRFVCL